ncbi:MAG: VTT domain-containing protein [Chloroflexi bacterium]|nr:VTT domain-containing protein [Chloroflexota bacterium]MCC6892496.1 VTT domain-containing protein [Anaerolineae bacterium]
MIEFIITRGPIIAYMMIFGIIFAESGLLIGFFLPGDSLLFTAGFLASDAGKELLVKFGLPAEQPFFSLTLLVIGCFAAAIVGDSVGYAFGRRVGKHLFQREDSRLFNKKNLYKAQGFYEKHGGKAIILARFVPVVRTFAPIVAGIGDMKYTRFVTFNVVGGFVWAVGVTVAGYFLAAIIGPDNIDKYLLPIIVLIVVISLAPPAYHLWKERQAEKQSSSVA